MANPLTNKEVLQKLSAANTEKVKLAVTDIDGVLRGKVISFVMWCLDGMRRIWHTIMRR
jgi:glutamine synthetase